MTRYKLCPLIIVGMKQDTIIFLFFYLFAILIGIVKTGEYGKPVLMASALFGIIYAILYYRKAIREGFDAFKDQF